MENKKDIKELGEVDVKCYVKFDDDEKIYLIFELNNKLIAVILISEEYLKSIFGVQEPKSDEELIRERLRALGYLD